MSGGEGIHTLALISVSFPSLHAYGSDVSSQLLIQCYASLPADLHDQHPLKL